MNLLIFNCGSSSQSFTVFDPNGKRIAKGKARNVNTPTKGEGRLEWTIGETSGSLNREFPFHKDACEAILDLLEENAVPFDAVAHRFVNGGESFDRAVEITEQTLPRLENCLTLAPIHNPNSYEVIRYCGKRLPQYRQFAAFDTAFHRNIPEEAANYAIDPSYGYRKTGFHGLSYQYVSERAAELLGKPLQELRLILCHLGTGGSSVCAMQNGHSVENSMGYSPLSGLVMSTRCGDIDPQIVLDLIEKGKTADEVSDLLNRESGLIGLSGYSSNLNEIIEAAENGNERCQLAFDVYAHRLRRYIGAFLYELGGADALIFTDDIGQNCPPLRAAACKGAESFGIRLDPAANKACFGKSETFINAPASEVKIMVIPTDEELTIYREVLKCL